MATRRSMQDLLAAQQAAVADDASHQPSGEPSPNNDHDVTTSRGHDVTTPRTRVAAAPRGHAAPTAVGAVSFTVRFAPAEAIEIDELALALRRELGRGRLDKSEIVRALLTLARDDADVRRTLIRQLRK